MRVENSESLKKPRSRGAALIKTNAQVRSEMARIYRSYNAGEMSMEEMNKRFAVLDKIRLTLIEQSKPRKQELKEADQKLTIREKLVLNRIERTLDKHIYDVLKQYVKMQESNAQNRETVQHEDNVEAILGQS